jgi:hypothetical protein
MAKNITLSVQVDDSQFQKFVRDYTTFSKQVQNLNVKFNTVNNSITKAYQQSVSWNNVLRSIGGLLTSIVPGMVKVTEHFGKWAALVGSVSMMLGTGAGLFGLERLANALVQRRRQYMTIGGGWGGIQRGQLATMGTIQDPMSIMQTIRLGQMGNREARVGMQAAGVDMQDFLNKDPSEIYEQIIRNIPNIVRSLPVGQEAPALEQRKLTNVMPLQDWMKFIKPGGGLNEDEHRRILNRLEEEKKQGLTPEAGRSWADLYEAARSFVMQIQTSLGNALSGIAGSLTEVSKGFQDLVKALLDMPAVKAALEQLKTWLDGFANYLKSDEAKKKLQDWTEEMEKVPWAKLGETIGIFISNLGTVIRALLALKGLVIGATVGGAVGGPVGAVIGGAGGAAAGWFSPDLLMWGLRSLGGGTSGDPNAPSNFNQRFGDWRTQHWWGGGMVPHPNMFNQNWWTQPPTFPVNPMNPNATVPPAATGGNQTSITGGTSFAGGTSIGGGSLALAGGGGGGGSRTGNMFASGDMTNWRIAARGAVPSTTGSNFASLMAMNNANFVPGARGRVRSGGPLDIDNWQMNRTASLRVDTVPGANVHMTGVAMA